MIKAFETRIADLDKKLRPIADLPVDITEPGWAQRLSTLQHPLDQAGVRSQMEALLRELISTYQTGSDGERRKLQELFKQFKAFAWAASLTSNPTTTEGFREHLLLFAMKDQGSDPRDALLTLQDLCRQARIAGVDVSRILKEVAQLSSDVQKSKMGSTKEMLLRAC